MNKSLLMASALVLGLTACGQSNSSTAAESTVPSEVKQEAHSKIAVGAEDFQARLNNEAEGEYQLIDVRTPEEFNGGHLIGAQNINFYDANFQNQLASLNKDQTVYVYCRSGGRSGNAAKMMSELGFKSIVDMSGGFMSWSSKGLPSTK